MVALMMITWSNLSQFKDCVQQTIPFTPSNSYQNISIKIYNNSKSSMTDFSEPFIIKKHHRTSITQQSPVFLNKKYNHKNSWTLQEH